MLLCVGIGLLYIVIVFGGGASLLVIPVGTNWATPDRKRPIWFPLIGSAALASVVFLGAGVATAELAGGWGPRTDALLWAALAGVPVVWLVWAVVFGLMARRTDPLSLNGRMYKTLVAGSVLELLVAVPMHLIVRQRGECCGGVFTAFGIGVGLIVAVLALGPAVAILFVRRYRQAYAAKR